MHATTKSVRLCLFQRGHLAFLVGRAITRALGGTFSVAHFENQPMSSMVIVEHQLVSICSIVDVKRIEHRLVFEYI